MSFLLTLIQLKFIFALFTLTLAFFIIPVVLLTLLLLLLGFLSFFCHLFSSFCLYLSLLLNFSWFLKLIVVKFHKNNTFVIKELPKLRLLRMDEQTEMILVVVKMKPLHSITHLSPCWELTVEAGTYICDWETDNSHIKAKGRLLDFFVSKPRPLIWHSWVLNTLLPSIILYEILSSDPLADFRLIWAPQWLDFTRIHKTHDFISDMHVAPLMAVKHHTQAS